MVHETALRGFEGTIVTETARPEPHLAYARAAQETIARIVETQTPAIVEAARLCADSILRGGLVHMFGSGHSRIAVEEMYPRYGSFPGFHPMVELSMTNHHQVVGSNGQRQAMFIENVEGLGRVILSNFRLDPVRDLMLVVSSSGTNTVPIEVALGAQEQGLSVIAITSVEHSRLSHPKHSSGRRLFEIADVVLDTCTPAGDAAVYVEGLDTPVGPLTTIANVTIVNMLKADVAEILTRAGKPPAA